MIRTLTVMSITMAIALVLHSLGWADTRPKIKLSAQAEVEVKVLNEEGRSIIKRMAARKVIPGTEVIYTIAYHNPANQTAEGLVITNPIPKQMHYRTESVFGSEAIFSVDNGHSFDRPENLYTIDATGNRYPAKPSEYTHIRWQLQEPVPPQATGKVGFRAVLQ